MSVTDIACPTSTIEDPHNVDWILATQTWHCRPCGTCGDIQDGTVMLRAVNPHTMTSEERTVWTRFYAGALIEQQA